MRSRLQLFVGVCWGIIFGAFFGIVVRHIVLAFHSQTPPPAATMQQAADAVEIAVTAPEIGPDDFTAAPPVGYCRTVWLASIANDTRNEMLREWREQLPTGD
jgi:hypothetical protein